MNQYNDQTESRLWAMVNSLWAKSKLKARKYSVPVLVLILASYLLVFPSIVFSDCTWSSLIGDVDGNEQITPGDALEIFWASINGTWAAMENYCCLDANKDGTVTPGDALMVFWYSIYQETVEGVTGYVGEPCRVNTTPTAAFTVDPASGTVNTLFNLDASSCSDNEDATSALQVRWDFENDGTFDTEWEATKTISHQYLTEGVKTVKLEVKDTEGLTDTETKQVNIVQLRAPTLISPSNGSATNDNTPTFDWGNVPGVVAYEFMVDNDGNFGSPEIGQTSLTSSTYTPDNSLLDGTYYWKVRGKDSPDNWSVWSNIWTVTIDTEAPDVPTLVSPTNGARTNDTTPTFNWSSVAGATKYHLRVTYGIDNMFVNDSTLTVSIYTVLSNMSDMTYYWMVRASDPAGNWSDWTGAWAVTIDTEAPDVPTLISPTNGSSTNDNTPTFDWSDVARATRYHLQVKYGFDNMFVNDSALTVSIYISLSNMPDMTYYWRVRAGDAAGNWSVWTGAWTVTVDTRAPGVPTLFSPTNGSSTNDNRPTFDWSDVARAAVYELIVDNEIDFSNPEISQTSLVSSTYTPGNSLSDGTYYWKVRANNGLDSLGAWSDAWSVTIDTEAPDVPTLISPTNGSSTNDNTPTFDWSDVATASKYHLQVTYGFDNLIVDDSSLTASTYTAFSGMAYMTYYWRVRAGDVAGNWSNWSAECSLAINDTVTDVDGNVYRTVTIGTQVWMAENLKVTHYRNGDEIPNVAGNSEWANLTTGACCDYDNNADNVSVYGRLYNWYAVNDSRGIAPAGWHVPTDEEWKQLEMYLGMSQSDADDIGSRGTDEGGKMKEAGTSHWNNPNAGATNESGFSALPGGYRRSDNGFFHLLGNYAYFWSSTENDSTNAWYRRLNYDYSDVYRYYGHNGKRYGFSVRCVRDN